MKKEKDTVVKIIHLIRIQQQQNLNDNILQERITNIVKELKDQIKEDVLQEIKKDA